MEKRPSQKDPNQETEGWRLINLELSTEITSSEYESNRVNSSRYTMWNFLPLNLFDQFMRPSNIWFLYISILETTVLSYEESNVLATSLSLLLLLIFTAAKDASSDYKRSISDRKTNNELCLVWNGNSFIEKKCENIWVGEVVLLQNKQKAPADMVLICTGSPNFSCYLDTSGIIGERDLKIKSSVKDVQNLINIDDVNEAAAYLKLINGKVKVEAPNKDFSSFSGKLILGNSPKASVLTIENFIFRGAKICNTPWIFGLVVYGGVEGKTWKTNTKYIRKSSGIEKRVNRIVVIMIIVVILLSAFEAIMNRSQSSIIFENETWLVFFRFNSVFSELIPLPLLVIIDVVRMIRQWRINSRKDGVEFKTGDVYENLGQVEYLLTDKTGTLTQESLTVQLCIIGENDYWSDTGASDEFRRGEQLGLLSYGTDRNFLNPEDADLLVSQASFAKRSLVDLKTEFLTNLNDDLCHFFTCLGLCNVAIPLESGEYLTTVAEDTILLELSETIGLKLTHRDRARCKIEMLDDSKEYLIWGLRDASSESKRTRIIVQNSRSDEVIVYVKGSLDTMLDILNDSHNRLPFLESILKQSQTSSLQFIVIGYRILKHKEAQEFKLGYRNAKQCPVNSERRIESVFEEIEIGAEYLGCVGIQEEITEETRNAVTVLKSAGIKIWILSGDSEESTISAGIGSSAIADTSEIVRLCNVHSEVECYTMLNDALNRNIFKESIHGLLSKDESIKESEVDSPTSPLQSVFSYARNESSLVEKDESNIMYHLDTSKEKALPVISKRAHRLSNELSLRRDTVNPLVSRLTSMGMAPSVDINRPFNINDLNFVLSVDNKTLEYSLENSKCRQLLVTLLFTAQSTCFHSLLPDDKTKVAKLLKESFSFRPVFLAVGDSGSDVGMIQEAHIGVGLMGNEGAQAANASEIVITKFSDLTELILCEGHWSYSNVSKIILLLIYKSVLINAVIFFYTPVDFYSGALINRGLISVFIIFLNVWNIIGIGAFDQQLNSNEISEYPEMHSSGVYNTYFSDYSLWSMSFQAIIHAGIISIFLNIGFIDLVGDFGFTENLLMTENFTFIVITIIVQCLTILETSSFNKLTIYPQIISLLFFLLILLCFSFIPSSRWNGNLVMIFESPKTIIYIILVVLLSCVVSYAIRAYSTLFSPSLIDFIGALKIRMFNFEIFSRIYQYNDKLEKVFKDSNDDKVEADLDTFDINLWTLRFKSRAKQDEYIKGKFLSNVKMYRIIVIFDELRLIGLLADVFTNDRGDTVMVTVLVAFALSSFFLAFTFTRFFKRKIRFYINAFYVFSKCCTWILVISYRIHLSISLTLIPIYYILGFNIDWYIKFTVNILSSIVILSKSAIINHQVFEGIDFAITFVQFVIFWITIFITCIMVSYNLEFSNINEFMLTKKVRTEVLKAKDVLELLLPKFVLKRVKEGIRYIADDQGIVTILFCNICDFDQIIIDYTPQEITSLLDEVYGKFDQLCELVGVTKIETVGKTYMACAGLKDSESELDQNFRSVPHARRVIEMGIEIINSAQKIITRNGECLHVQIGINSGPVTAGVVGSHKPQYSLVGDTVNMASRMASTIKERDAIQISMATYKELSNKRGLLLIPHTVYAKGKGEVETYIVKVDNVPDNLFSEFARRVDTVRHTGTMIGSMLMPTISMHVGSFSDHVCPVIATYETKRMSGLYTNLVNGQKDKLFKRKESDRKEKMSIINFKCKETEAERNFRKIMLEDNYDSLKCCLIGGIVSNICGVFVHLVWIALNDANTPFFLIFFPLEIIGYIAMLKLLKKYYSFKWFAWMLQLFYSIGTLVLLCSILYIEQNLQDLINTCILYHFLLLTHGSALLYGHIIIFAVFTIGLWFVANIIRGFRDLKISTPLTIIIFGIICLITLYHRVIKLRTYSTLRTKSQKELTKVEELVNKMMPPHAYKHLKDKHSVTDRFSQVTILYADIVGFTAWSSDKNPDEILGMLYELFSRFDNMCIEHKVYKVHTIGDCYVAMGYTGNSNRDPGQECVNMVEFAQSMIRVIQDVNEINGSQLNMRIGMHTGDVIGGIIGRYIVRYDIYGSGVLVANMIESNGLPGEIAMSEVTQLLLKRFRPSKYIFEQIGEVNVPVLQRNYSIYSIHNSS